MSEVIVGLGDYTLSTVMRLVNATARTVAAMTVCAQHIEYHAEIEFKEGMRRALHESPEGRAIVARGKAKRRAERKKRQAARKKAKRRGEKAARKQLDRDTVASLDRLLGQVQELKEENKRLRSQIHVN